MNAEVRWLDDVEMAIWRSFLETGGRLTTLFNESMKQSAGLTFEDYEVLVHLSEAEPEQLRMSELSRRLLHSQSRLTQRVDRLGKRGLVRREKCPDDGRGTFACLTDSGRALVHDVAPRHVEDVRRWLIDLIEPAEREVIATVLARIADNARAADG